MVTIFDNMKQILERDNFYADEEYHPSNGHADQFLTDDVNNDFIHQSLSNFINY